MAFSTGNPVDVPQFELSVPEITDVQEGLAWFKLTAGMLFMAIGVGAMGRVYYVRNVFEIRARSPYLVIMSGFALLGLLGLTVYLAAFQLYPTITVDVYGIYIGFYFFAFLFSGCFWCRVVRLGLAYCPRARRRLPWLMNERLLVVIGVFIAVASTSIPLYKMYTITGPFAWVLFAEDQEDQLFDCQVGLLIVTVLLIPIVWRVDDLFKISTEILVVTVILIMQTGGIALTDVYASEEVSHWINQENIPFMASIVMIGLVVIDPIRRLAFNPMTKTYPAIARAQDRRRMRGLRNLKKIQVSNTTDSDSWRESQDSQSASASELQTPRRRRWSYESLAGVPGMAATFRAFAFRALCQESVIFLEEIAKYQRGEYSMCDAENRSQKAAFLAIVARFIIDGSPDEVNISYADKKKIVELSRNDAERFDLLLDDHKRTVFGEAYVEIRYMLESNLLQRFTETSEFKEQELTVPPPPARSRQRRHANNFNVDDVNNSNDDDVNNTNNDDVNNMMRTLELNDDDEVRIDFHAVAGGRRIASGDEV